MPSPSGGSGKSSGMRVAMRKGSSEMPEEVSTVSATTFSATQQPEKRDMAQPCRPKSRISCTLAGFSTGIMAAAKMWSL